jgi:hypothetical protein
MSRYEKVNKRRKECRTTDSTTGASVLSSSSVMSVEMSECLRTCVFTNCYGCTQTGPVPSGFSRLFVSIPIQPDAILVTFHARGPKS